MRELGRAGSDLLVGLDMLEKMHKALEYIPKEQLVISTDCGFGREGLSRRIAFYKCVALVEGTNIVRRELGLPEARVRAAGPKLWFAGRETINPG
jgi:5-methyltetrahydropteroyltriglutamate--homocysteine methyltransferase